VNRYFPFFVPRGPALVADFGAALRFADAAVLGAFFRGAVCFMARPAGFTSPVLTAIFPRVEPIASAAVVSASGSANFWFLGFFTASVSLGLQIW
jgi:hypothetical protein